MKLQDAINNCRDTIKKAIYNSIYQGDTLQEALNILQMLFEYIAKQDKEIKYLRSRVEELRDENVKMLEDKNFRVEDAEIVVKNERGRI